MRENQSSVFEETISFQNYKLDSNHKDEYVPFFSSLKNINLWKDIEILLQYTFDIGINLKYNQKLF